MVTFSKEFIFYTCSGKTFNVSQFYPSFFKNVMIIYSLEHIVTLHFFQVHYYQSFLHYNANLIHLLNNKLVDQKYTLLRNTVDMLTQNHTKALQKYKEPCLSLWRTITLFDLFIRHKLTEETPANPEDMVVLGQGKIKHLALLKK